MLLYVRSTRTSEAEKPPIVLDHFGIYYDPTSDSRTAFARETTNSYSSEEQFCIELLQRTGCLHEVIDLSNCSLLARFKARMAGLSKTPLLVLDNKRIRGLENIREFLKQHSREARA